MATVTATGVTPGTLEGYIARYQDAVRTALGDTADLDPETPAGQLVAALSNAAIEIDEAVVSVGNGQSLANSVGYQVDDNISLLDFARILSAHSTVDVTLSGVVGTVIPAMSLAEDTASNRWTLTAAAQIGSGGTVAATMMAVEAGAITAAAATVTGIVTLVSGWEQITNAAAATAGRLAESDAEVKTRYGEDLGSRALGKLTALESAISAVDGVTHRVVHENKTAADVTTRNIVIPAHGVTAIVEGGQNSAVAAALARQSGGAQTGGATTVTHTNDNGTDTDISFQRTALIGVAATVTVHPLVGLFPGDGTLQIRDNLVAYVNALPIGDGIDQSRAEFAVLSVPGHSITTTLAITRMVGTDGVLTADLDLHQRLTLDADDVTVSIS